MDFIQLYVHTQKNTNIHTSIQMIQICSLYPLYFSLSFLSLSLYPSFIFPFSDCLNFCFHLLSFCLSFSLPLSISVFSHIRTTDRDVACCIIHTFKLRVFFPICFFQTHLPLMSSHPRHGIFIFAYLDILVFYQLLYNTIFHILTNSLTEYIISCRLSL